LALSASGNRGRYGVEQEDSGYSLDGALRRAAQESQDKEKEAYAEHRTATITPEQARNLSERTRPQAKPTRAEIPEARPSSSSSSSRHRHHSSLKTGKTPPQAKPTRAALKEAQKQKEEQIVREFRKAISEGKNPEEAAKQIEQKYGVKVEIKEVSLESESREPLDRAEAIGQSRLHPQEPEQETLFDKANEAVEGFKEQLSTKRLELLKTGDRAGPIEKFGVGVGLFGIGLAAGAANIAQSTVQVAKTAIDKGPIEAGKELAYGTYEWVKNIPNRLLTGLRGDPFIAGELAGEVVGGYYLGKGTAKVVGGPFGKFRVITEQKIGQIKGTYVEEPGIKFVESYTYEPVSGDVLVQQVAGKEATLVHMTQHKAFNVKPGEQLLLEAKPEQAAGFRKQFDALHWYQSAPAPTGEPLGYLAYVGIGEGVSESLKITIRKPKTQAVVTHDVIQFVKPRPGETFAEYQVRTGQMSGKTLIPGENVFGYSTERQVITPAHFESQLVQGLEYPGTYLRKVRDVGWTHYRQVTLPRWLRDTRVGRFLQKLGYGEKYHKIHISEWEKIPVETAKRVEKLAEEFEERAKTLDLARYNEEYGRVRYVSVSEIISSIARTGLFLGYSVGSYSRSGGFSIPSYVSSFGELSSAPKLASKGVRSSGSGSTGKSKGSGGSGGGSMGGYSGGSDYSGYGLAGYTGYSGSGGGGYSGYGGSGEVFSGGGRTKMPIGAGKTERRYRRPKERFRFWLYVNPVATPYELLFGRRIRSRGGRRARKKVKRSRRR
jgi:hypothetical protein